MNNVESRRKFLKKAAYAAPVVFALGAMTAPISAHASNLGRGNGPQGNNGHGNGDQVAPGNSGEHNNAENRVVVTAPKSRATVRAEQRAQKALAKANQRARKALAKANQRAQKALAKANQRARKVA